MTLEQVKLAANLTLRITAGSTRLPTGLLLMLNKEMIAKNMQCVLPLVQASVLTAFSSTGGGQTHTHRAKNKGGASVFIAYV